MAVIRWMAVAVSATGANELALNPPANSPVPKAARIASPTACPSQ